VVAWYRRDRLVWMLGPAAWVLLALAGWLHARMTGLPVLPLILTYDEWFAALLLLPSLATLGAAAREPEHGGAGVRSRLTLVRMGYVPALIVFSLDLLVRALFGLGWEPFFLE
jgi:hypothetical protein